MRTFSYQWIAFLCLTSVAFAQTPNPADAVATAEAAYEWQVVSTGSRKMLELQRETDAAVVTAVPQFLQGVAARYPGKPVLYGAMSAAGADMAGRGPTYASTYPTMYHVTSASSFYTYNVSDNWKKLTAQKLSSPGRPVDWQAPEVFDAWKAAVTNGQNIPTDMLLPDSTGLRALSWVSPDQRMVRPSSSTRQQGNSDFFAMCHILSLAPEWYPDGLVNLRYDELGRPMVRPVSFDGMLSPLWVQRPPNQSAATGGDAVEALNKDAVPLSGMGPAQAYIVTSEMTAALKEAATKWPVSAYAEDLDKAARDTGAAVTQLGSEQKSIVQEVRRARRAADAAFRQQTASLPMPLVAAASDTVSGTSAAMKNAAREQRNPASRKALADDMVAWARGGYVQHRGQRFAAERFRSEAERSPAAARAIIAAATDLLRRSDDPEVLQLVAQLGPDTSYRSFYVAIVDRLSGKGKPLPNAAGLRTKTLRGDLMLRLAERIPAGDKSLSRRARFLLTREGRDDVRLAMLLQAGRDDLLVVALKGAARDPGLDPWLAARVALVVARQHPERLHDAAAEIARLPAATRGRFMETVQEAAPHWYRANGRKLAQAAKAD